MKQQARKADPDETSEVPLQHAPDRLNSSQQLHLLNSCKYADRLLSEAESILFASASKSPFPKYQGDLAPTQVKVIEDYIARIRAQMVLALKSQGISPPAPTLGAVRSIRVNLEFADIAFDECRPEAMKGYGEFPDSLVPELNGLVEEMKGLLRQLSTYLAQDLGKDLQRRLQRLEGTTDEIGLLKILERVINGHGLVEFRSSLSIILDKLEGNSFQIAVFGRVSSGKSSLLNHILQTEVLPVGVNPITTVPTRIVHSPDPALTVSYVDGKVERTEISRLPEFVSEEFNPANAKRVTRIVVGLPSSRLRDGIAFVDTPGLGSLATAGAAETLAYLPRCDLGLVLIDAGSTLTAEDLATLRSLYEAAIPARVLLSKADLLNADDRVRSMQYVADHVRSQLGLELPVHPVSTRGENAGLLEQWFTQDLQPLFERYQELSEQSLRRKIGALGEAVEAALRVRLELSEAGPSTERKHFRAAEALLRKATGRFELVNSSCLRTADAIRELGDAALSRAASEVARYWIRGERTGDDTGVLIRQSIAETAAEGASPIFRAIRELAGELAEALGKAAIALEAKDATTGEELGSVAKEMPRFDIGMIDVRLRRGFGTFLGEGITKWRVTSRLHEELGPSLNEAFHSYGRLLESWSRRTLEELRRQFEGHAGGYRAQLERLTGGRAATTGEIEAVRRDLELLSWPVQKEPVSRVPGVGFASPHAGRDRTAADASIDVSQR